MTPATTPAAKTDPGAERHDVRVAEPEAGRRLDRLLADALPHLSRTRLKALIIEGRVRHDGAPAATITEPSYRVKPGQIFAVFVPDATPPRPLAQDIAVTVIYEDDDLLVIDKPAGLVVHPAPGNPDGTLVNALIAHCGDSLSGIGGVRRPGIVHRLDKETSGLMVVAKNDRAHAGLAGQFEARTVERAYHAVVWGVPAAASGTIEGNIGRSPRNRKKMAVVAGGGKPALTRWRIERRFGTAASILQCRLATGRTHQIRVHLAHRAVPVIGDRGYGGGLTPARRRAVGDAAVAVISGLTRHALDAYVIGFEHPVTGETHRYSHDFPKDLKPLIDLLDRV
jgi:23S rRNA pseudouridine1911/1915/1917 synthase